jgi:hypothetical protein
MEDYAIIGSTSGILALISLIAAGIYKVCYHSRCKSKCLGKEAFDISSNLSKSESPKEASENVSTARIEVKTDEADDKS